ncbi:hypothetical protein P3T76_008029 [Phytophthora citrophthora]|uniref:Uncharacterized protein n=1 Tax=Phytophthora citrophthora TaxID=4793 RepID=A0AAD9GLX3_9STRA|nr:hypothetical protein P3T76_008029 [Phytophthora citrophthora]
MGVGVLLNLLGEVYSNAIDVCEMYPQFSFYDTILEEMSMHHTRLPLLRVHVPTLHLLGAYTAAYAAKYWGLLDWGWPLLLELLSGRWLYHQVFEVLPTYLPFVFSEPDVPELLSEDEARGLEDEDDFDDVPPSPPVDNDACNEALAKLVQVKMQHANRTILRPDDWLVFDPVQEKLVLQKEATHVNGTVLDGHSNGSVNGKVSLPRAQEPLGDNQAAAATCAAAMRVEKVVGTAALNQPQEVAPGIRKRV